MKPTFAGHLLPALKRISKDFGTTFSFKDPGQFARRLNNDLKTIEDAGIRIKREYSTVQKTHKYHIELLHSTRS